ncbi:MAG: SDR family oxidoreductase [Bacteroidetes bacterium]|nr:MAG: SDR family oxidoreductase [Bacteroidota bacterium]
MTLQHEKKTVLITGGSSGIGFALAKAFAHRGYKLVLVARDGGKLDKSAKELRDLFGVPCETIVLDLSLVDSPETLHKRLHAEGILIDVLVNNAGFGTWGNFWEIDSVRSQQEMQLNMVTLALLTKRIANEMIQRGNGKILNVASTASYQPGPMMAIYYATKAFVVSFSEALSKELDGTGVTVTVVCPGPTETKFQRHAGMAKMHLLKKIFMMDADTVAEKAYRGLMKGKRVVIPGLMNKMTVFSVRFLPKAFILAVVSFLHKRRG